MSSLINVEKPTRDKIQEVINKYNLKQVDIAKETGINHSSLSLWLQGKIKGHEKLTTKIEQGMKEWLSNFEQHLPQFREQQEVEKNPYVEYDNSVDCLVPISVDAEVDGLRYKDFFCWNVSEPQLTPEQFAKIICEENNFPQQIESEISSSIKRAITNFKPYQYTNSSEENLRIIEIQIRINKIQYKDQFEWDISDQNNNPEAFAWSVAEELGLPGEFATRIAHSLREQIQFYQKQMQDKLSQGFIEDRTYKKQTRSLYDMGTGLNQFDNTKANIQPSIINDKNYIRPFQTIGDPDYLAQWEPNIDVLDENEIRRAQKQEERQSRYNKRVIR
ncbi:Lambda repressor-like, DNA-binding domain [Pseudocohnilembus persalinus]|uniref:Lambda repressor-like, DNA-binding domain n=1 Tax=Pseudocohnilembus persalinus TaxID=266149 RepID=A0A0V0R3Q0_PSEPJ|nr:Lambda repressor-like, DNA-binding domain [Pseudocohnilembus persalinus]|eukprot:KRX09116.1 Lambda repressor-like, DNA-binding domain [Pseudocohnilembus persalinus]